ncbi:MAG TPA: S9 family peptidase, partial [Planctomycetota bacterium]|nr:S9 family peptidase [Planctomycetota bacterium]
MSRAPAALAALAALLAAACAAPEVPLTRTVDHVDDYHGTKVPDPYRWLEDAAAEEVRAWVEAQNARTEEFLAGIADREPLRKRLTELWDFERFGVPRKEGSRLFYSRNDGL